MHDTGQQDEVFSLPLCMTQANRMRCFHCSYARHRPTRCVFTAAMHDTGQQDEVFSLQLCTTQANRMRCFHCSYARHRPTRCVNYLASRANSTFKWDLFFANLHCVIMLYAEVGPLQSCFCTHSRSRSEVAHCSMTKNRLLLAVGSAEGGDGCKLPP